MIKTHIIFLLTTGMKNGKKVDRQLPCIGIEKKVVLKDTTYSLKKEVLFYNVLGKKNAVSNTSLY